jgi:hypothetical protein
MARVDVGEDTVLVLQAAVVADGRVRDGCERAADAAVKRARGACVYEHGGQRVGKQNEPDDGRAALDDALSIGWDERVWPITGPG